MREIFSGIFSGVGITDAIDILIVAFVVYKILEFIKETRAEQLVKGLVVLIAVTFISEVCHLYTLNWILTSTLALGVIALVIVFQPELRRGLEYVGRSKLVPNKFGQIDKERAKFITTEFVRAMESFSQTRTGALIVIERETALTDIIETGTVVDAEPSRELLKNIFWPKAPMHDGAVVVRNGRVAGAGCMLPLSGNTNISRELGMRHRAGIGVTEHTDAVSVICSEETGSISVAVNGTIRRHLAPETLSRLLKNELLATDEADKKRSAKTPSEQLKNIVSFFRGKKEDSDHVE